MERYDQYTFPGTALVDSLREVHEGTPSTAPSPKIATTSSRELVSEYGGEALTLMTRVLPVAA